MTLNSAQRHRTIEAAITSHEESRQKRRCFQTTASQAASRFSATPASPLHSCSLHSPHTQCTHHSSPASEPGEDSIPARAGRSHAGCLARGMWLCPLENRAITSPLTSGALCAYIDSGRTQPHRLRGSLWRAFVNHSRYWNPT